MQNYKLNQSPKTSSFLALSLELSRPNSSAKLITRIPLSIRRCLFYKPSSFDSLIYSASAMEKSVDKSYQVQHGGKDDSNQTKKRSVVTSSKLGASRGSNRDKLVGLGDRLDKSQQSNLKKVSKPNSVPVVKRKLQKTAGTSPKDHSGYNLRSKNQIIEGAKGSPSYNLRNKVQKTEGQNASTNVEKRKPQKDDGSKDSVVAVQKSGILKNLAPKKIETPKPLTASLADLDKKKHALTSQYETFFREPIYHIRWEGDDLENGPLGQKCILCNKDLSGTTEDDSEHNDDFQYDDDDDDDDDDYIDEIMPTLLPAVDILACGHAYHTECLQQRAPEEQSSDPQCVLCSRMA